jgi:hypothetical protein
MSRLPSHWVWFWAIANALMAGAGELRAGVVLVTSRSDLGGPGVGGNDSVNWGTLGPSGMTVVPSTTEDQTFSIVSTGGRSVSVESAADDLRGGGANLTVGTLVGRSSLSDGQHFAITTPPLPEFDTDSLYTIRINFATPVAAAGADVLGQLSFGEPFSLFGVFQVNAFSTDAQGHTANIGGYSTQFSNPFGTGSVPLSGFYGLRSDAGPVISSIWYQMEFPVQSRFSYDSSFALNQLDIIVPATGPVREPSTLIMGVSAAFLGLGYLAARLHGKIRAATGPFP